MKTRLDKKEQVQYVEKQLQLFFPDNQRFDHEINGVIDRVFERIEASFSKINSRYYQLNGCTYFNHLNTDHYASFLYLLSNELYRAKSEGAAEKVFALNKALHGLDAFFAINLPEVFLFVHPLGAVLGNANYSNRLVVYQNVTVGSDIDGVYPSFGEGCVLYSGVSVIGNVISGKNCVFGANAFVRACEVPDSSTVVGMYPDFNILKSTPSVLTHYFR